MMLRQGLRHAAFSSISFNNITNAATKKCTATGLITRLFSSQGANLQKAFQKSAKKNNIPGTSHLSAGGLLSVDHASLDDLASSPSVTTAAEDKPETSSPSPSSASSPSSLSFTPTPGASTPETPYIAGLSQAPVIASSTRLANASMSQAHMQTHICTEFAPKISVIGVGGAGGNAVNNMIMRGLSGVEFLVCNTDAQHLATTLTDNRLQIGRDITQGLGCGANPDVGKVAGEESKAELLERIGDSHMVFITAGMGGGTGTGAAPIIAKTCHEAGILTVAVVTRPFRFEGSHRMRLAEEGLRRLQDSVDTLLIIPNQNLFKMVDPSTTLLDAFRLADDVLLAGVKSVTDLMTMPGLINLDFADVQSVMSGMGNAIMGTGQASGEDRALRAAEDALQNPLLGQVSIKSAKGMLVNITGGPDMTLFEVDKAAQRVTEEVEDEHANIIFGSAYEASLAGTKEDGAGGSIRVSIVATGIEETEAMKTNIPTKNK
ncbi:cell division protein [Nannochloropsis gaditana]|uniref:Cell division protein n=1 Tax=Nannochloropsis gaditana TaxID=72520 RepID=W7TYP0_9STRA|nr:cell division protein [Nannochloropsis gaditana]